MGVGGVRWVLNFVIFLTLFLHTHIYVCVYIYIYIYIYIYLNRRIICLQYFHNIFTINLKWQVVIVRAKE